MNREIVESVAAGAKAIKDTAQRLGLTWSLRPGTIQPSDSGAIQVSLDGDQDVARVTVVSLIGPVVPLSRVMVLIIPDAMFVIGNVTGAVPRVMTNRVLMVSNADVTLTTSYQVVPNTLVTVVTSGLATWEVIGDFDMDTTGAGTTIMVGSLFVDGVQQTGDAVWGSNAVTERVNVVQMWDGTFHNAGAHNFQLQAIKTVNVGTNVVQGIGTRINVKTFE
jgi:hypothetical protein